MHVLQTFEDLINNILLMNVLKDVSSDNSVQIRVHEVENQVDVSVIFCTNDVLETDDVLVARQLLKENNFTEGTLGVCCVLKGIKIFLKSHNFFSSLVNGFPNNTVSTLS